MAKLIDHLDLVLPAFEKWYRTDHGPNEDFYAKKITKQRLSNISDKDLVEFFVEFRRDGGHIQSQGERGIEIFEKMIKNSTEDFRNHILKPFFDNFDVKNWLKERKQFTQWGFGIATIYLVMVNKNKYPVLNNKTISGLNILGFENITSTNESTYLHVSDIQSRIIELYPQIENYFKADALCHYVFAEEKVKDITSNFLKLNKKSSSIFIDELEHDRASNSVQSDKTLSSKKQILARIKSNNNCSSETINYKGKQLKRNAYTLALIKQLRDYECQFCEKKIVKKDGNLYIEACHIKQKSKGGAESLNNILILCPNCHKEFDLGDRKEITHSRKIYIVEVNGNMHNITFEDDIS